MWDGVRGDGLCEVPCTSPHVWLVVVCVPMEVGGGGDACMTGSCVRAPAAPTLPTPLCMVYIPLLLPCALFDFRLKSFGTVL